MSYSVKSKITEAVLNELPINNSYKNVSLNHLLFRWWTTGRAGQALRLNEEGKLAFTDANIEFYDFPLKPLNKPTLRSKEYTLKVGKKVKCPFYIGFKTQSINSAYIRIYDSKVAMMITLYGSFNEYLESG